MSILTPTVTMTADTRGLSQVLAEAAAIFCERGATQNMIQRFIEVEAGQLAGDAADAIGPKSQLSGMAGVKSDVKKFLDRPFSDRNQDSRDYFTGDKAGDSELNGMRWLYAGTSFLLGIESRDDQKGLGAESAYSVFRFGQKSGSRGKAYIDVGRRGKQKVVRLNRMLVSKTAFGGVVKKVSESFGKAKASFAAVCLRLTPSRNFPQWVTRHIEKVEAEGRSFLDTTEMSNPTAPTITFGSHAPGVVSNPKMVAALEAASKRRAEIARAKLDKLVRGAVYNLNTGQVYRVGNRELEADEI